VVKDYERFRKNQGKGVGNASSEIDAIYEYKNEEGMPLYEIVKYKDKHFSARRKPYNSSDYVWKLGKGVKQVLYRLPELLSASPNDYVFFCEGEKDVDNLINVGLVSTTNPFGAGKWSKSYSDSLANRKVIILPDNDKPGKDHAQKIAKQLLGKASEVRIMELPGLPPSGDVTDWLNNGGSKEKLLDLIAATTPLVLSKNGEQENLQNPYIITSEQLYYSIRLSKGGYSFAYLDEGKVKLVDKVTIDGQDIYPMELPINKLKGNTLEIVGMPDEGICTATLLEPQELWSKLTSHLPTVADMRKEDREICILYILFTWFYPIVNTVAYLRFLADTGKGKSRLQKVIGDLCFYPVYASGCSSFSGMTRLNERWHGTLILDEADLAGDKEHAFTKYLNCGFEKDKPFVLSDKLDPKQQEYFDPFSPKVLAMRMPFNDNATEGRLISISARQTCDPNMPVYLKDDYKVKVRELRNELARFSLEYYHELDPEKLYDFRDMPVEPRLRQIFTPLSLICQIWPESKGLLQSCIKERQREVKKTRSMSWDGQLFNLLCSIAVGDCSIDDDFKGYYKDEEKVPQAITPSMIAKILGTSPRTVTKGLTGIGFEVGKRYIEFTDKDGNKTKKYTKKYTVPDSQVWREAVNLYWYDESDSNAPLEVPDVLKGIKFVAIPDPNRFETDKTDKTENTTAPGFDAFLFPQSDRRE